MPDGSRLQTARLPLFGLACVAGDRLPLERALSRMPGVIAAYVNPVTESAHLTVDPEAFDIGRAVETIERFGAWTVSPDLIRGTEPIDGAE